MHYFVSLHTKQTQTMKKFLTIAIILTTTACSMVQRDDSEATAVATEWGEAFFNCDYHAAEALSTAESRRWLQFAASNTTQQDLDLLRQHPAEVDATDFFPEADDTLRVVQLVVRHSLSPAINGGQSVQVEEALFPVTVVKRNGSWLVRMASLPRSEKQSHD